jgi:hypothetical protein
MGEIIGNGHHIANFINLDPDQGKAWRQTAGELCYSADAEQDDADHEDSDPAEESEASGIGDQDGLDEQVPFRDWQNVGMV